MQCHKTKLANGLRLLTIPMPGFESATVTIWNNVGSRYETAKIEGIAHFFEHMVFKGGQKYPNAQAVSEAIDSFGGQCNASTGKEVTKYYIKAPVAKLEAAFDILSDMLLTPALDKKEIEKERGVIKAEIDMYEDLPMNKVEEIFENLIYEGSQLEKDIIGTKKTVNGITQSDFKRFLRGHYHADNMLVTVAGGVTPRLAKALAEKYFKSLPKSKKIKTQKFTYKHKLPKLRLLYKKTDQTHLVVGYLGAPHGHADRYPEAVLASVLGGGMSSRIFTEVREKRGLAYSVRTDADHYADTGSFTTYAGVTHQKAPEAIKTILAEYQKMTSVNAAKVSEQELKKAKEYLKGHLALSLESTNAVNSFFGFEELMTGQVRSVEEVYKGIDQVQIEDVIRVAKKFFRPERLNLAIIGPFKSEEKFAKLLS